MLKQHTLQNKKCVTAETFGQGEPFRRGTLSCWKSEPVCGSRLTDLPDTVYLYNNNNIFIKW